MTQLLDALPRMEANLRELEEAVARGFSARTSCRFSVVIRSLGFAWVSHETACAALRSSTSLGSIRTLGCGKIQGTTRVLN